MSNSKQIKPTVRKDKGNSRMKSIPVLPVPEKERSNKLAMNQVKWSINKQYFQ